MCRMSVGGGAWDGLNPRESTHQVLQAPLGWPILFSLCLYMPCDCFAQWKDSIIVYFTCHDNYREADYFINCRMRGGDCDPSP